MKPPTRKELLWTVNVLHTFTGSPRGPGNVMGSRYANKLVPGIFRVLCEGAGRLAGAGRTSIAPAKSDMACLESPANTESRRRFVIDSTFPIR